jgi:anti-sigma regulatory factor (Ser/Thr protein kinase)
MIDLGQTRAGLLAEINAPDPLGNPLGELADPRAMIRDTHLRICSHAQEQLFSLLKAVLLERFAGVARLELIGDLLIPLKNALGNAFKHGNGCDAAKLISVEIVLTGKGALIAVTDEGRGFDVALTFRRFQREESYFVHRGDGFRNLHRALATISYENGGRTVLLCFRPAMGLNGSSPGEDHALPNILDGEWVRNRLSAELPEFRKNGARIESCRVYATRGSAADNCGNRYVLRVAGHDGRLAETRVLAGRFHTTEAAADADVEAATQLNDARISNRLRIPRPLGRLAGEPRLVFYDVDPWMNLWEYFTHFDGFKALRRISRRIARALAHLHGSQVVFPGVEPERVEDGFQAMVPQAEKHLQTLPCGPDLVNRFRVAAQRIQSRAAFGRQPIAAPIHGSLGWDCIHYGVDGRFYLYRFEQCRCSDPGLDLGGFAADLLCFTLATHDEEVYQICLDAFLEKYNSEAAHPISNDDLLPYTARALVERLGRADSSPNADAGCLLAALEAALTSGPRGPESPESPESHVRA